MKGQHSYGLEREYSNPIVLKMIIEDQLENSFKNIYKKVKDINVDITEEKINSYLDSLIKSELKKVDDKYLTRDYDDEILEKDLKKNAIDLIYSTYKLDYKTLEYYKKYIFILKNKTLKLLDITDKIINDDYEKLRDLFNSLDIEFNEQDEILSRDIIRISEALLYNYKNLIRKIDEANDLDNYYKIRISNMLDRGIVEKELYPNIELQINNIELNNMDRGNISYTSKQVNKMK